MYAIRWSLTTPLRHVRGLYLAPFDGDPTTDTAESFAPRWTPERGSAHRFAARADADEVEALWSTDVRRYLAVVAIEAPASTRDGRFARVVAWSEVIASNHLTPVRCAILLALPNDYGTRMSVIGVVLAVRTRASLRERDFNDILDELRSLRDDGLVASTSSQVADAQTWWVSTAGTILRTAFRNAIEDRANQRET